MFDGILRKTAKKMVAVAQKFYEKDDNPMGYFAILNGIGYGRLAISPGDKHNYKLIIDEIHNYQAKHQNKNVKEGYRYALSCSIRIINDKVSLQNVFNYLNYEFEKQKNGTSGLSLDYKDVLKELRDELVKKADILRREYSDFDIVIKQNLEELERKSWERR